jgi:hypothetical protein
MKQPTVFRRYDSFHGIEAIGNSWTAARDGRTMRCALATHPLGWELRLTVGKELMRSQVCETQEVVFDVAEAWQAGAERVGLSSRSDDMCQTAFVQDDAEQRLATNGAGHHNELAFEQPG